MATAKDIISKLIPSYTYKVGEKGGSSIPFNVRLAIDKDFKKAVTTWVVIGSVAVGAGIATGIIISNERNKRRS